VVVSIRWRKNVSSNCISATPSSSNSEGTSLDYTHASKELQPFVCHRIKLWFCFMFKSPHLVLNYKTMKSLVVHDHNLMWICAIFIRLPKTGFPCHLTGRSAPCAARSALTPLFFLFLVLFFATAAYSNLSLRWVFYRSSMSKPNFLSITNLCDIVLCSSIKGALSH